MRQRTNLSICVVLIVAIATSVGCVESCPDFGLSIEKVDPASYSNETRERAVPVNVSDAEEHVPFFVDALRRAEQEGDSGLGGCEADAAQRYIDRIGAGFLITFEGSYFIVSTIAA